MTPMHPAAPHHLPAFITAPGETDPFLVGSAIGLVVIIFALGSLYFRLHALPEHLAHGNASKLQFEVIGALALLALFTHNNWFWVAALLLALVPIPDLLSPLAAMADSLATIAGRRRRPDDASPVGDDPGGGSGTRASTHVPAQELAMDSLAAGGVPSVTAGPDDKTPGRAPAPGSA